MADDSLMPYAERTTGSLKHQKQNHDLLVSVCCVPSFVRWFSHMSHCLPHESHFRAGISRVNFSLSSGSHAFNWQLSVMSLIDPSPCLGFCIGFDASAMCRQIRARAIAS